MYEKEYVYTQILTQLLTIHR